MSATCMHDRDANHRAEVGHSTYLSVPARSLHQPAYRRSDAGTQYSGILNHHPGRNRGQMRSSLPCQAVFSESLLRRLTERRRVTEGDMLTRTCDLGIREG